MSKYLIDFSSEDAPIVVEGWINVGPTLRSKYGHCVAIGHPGDLTDGGDRTLFWASEKEALKDAGALALGKVTLL